MLILYETMPHIEDEGKVLKKKDEAERKKNEK